MTNLTWPKKCFFAIFLPYLAIINLLLFSVNYDVSKLASLMSRQIKPLVEKLGAFSVSRAEPRPRKVVLLWTNYFYHGWEEMLALNNNSEVWTFQDNAESQPYSCLITSNRSYANEAQAIVFHGRDFNENQLPSVHFPWQRWVFFCLESPLYNNFRRNNYVLASRVGFNWVMTYRPSADVHFPYGRIDHKPEKQLSNSKENQLTKKRIENFVSDFGQRPVDGVWFVSKCDSMSKREYLYEILLELGLRLEKWGQCGGRFPENEWKNADAVNKFFTRYRYFLAFENSLCEDYITEKVYAAYYHSLKHGLIPVVYGGTNYSNFLPNGSYLDAGHIKLSRLAQIMRNLTLPTKRNELARYFDWQYTHELRYEIDPKTNYLKRDSAFRFGWQALCRRLWTAPVNETKRVTDLQSSLGRCNISPSFLHFGDEVNDGDE